MRKKLSCLLAMLLLALGVLTGCGSLEGYSAEKDESRNEIYDETSDETSDGMQNEELSDRAEETAQQDSEKDSEKDFQILEDQEYTSKEEVALYLHTFGHLPSNYITKKEAKKLGWESKEGNLGEAAPGKSIGGDYFGNFEGALPEKDGREYHECDIDSDGGYRGAKRIVYSNDGLIYYTEDHYETFELLYGEE